MQEAKKKKQNFSNPKDLSQIYKDYGKGKKFPKHVSTFKSSTFTIAAPFSLRDGQIPGAGRAPRWVQREKAHACSPALLEGATLCVLGPRLAS